MIIMQVSVQIGLNLTGLELSLATKVAAVLRDTLYSMIQRYSTSDVRVAFFFPLFSGWSMGILLSEEYTFLLPESLNFSGSCICDQCHLAEEASPVLSQLYCGKLGTNIQPTHHPTN